MKKLIVVAASMMAFVVLAQEAAAPRKGSRSERRRGAGMQERGAYRFASGGMFAGDPAVMAALRPRIARKIGLSAEVQAQLKKLDDESRQTLGDLQRKTRAAMERQATLVKAEKIDEAAVMAAIDELFDLRKAMAKAQTKRLIAVKSLLTAEQLEKALEEAKNMRAERRHRPGNGPRGTAGATKADEGAKGAAPTPAEKPAAAAAPASK